MEKKGSGTGPTTGHRNRGHSIREGLDAEAQYREGQRGMEETFAQYWVVITVVIGGAVVCPA